MNKKNPISLYLSKQGDFEVQQIETLWCPDIIVVIPSYYELHMTKSVYSLLNNKVHGIKTHIIVVVNQGELTPPEIHDINEKSVRELMEIQKGLLNEKFTLKVIKAFDLPKKTAGVGLARKIGMDHACRIFDFYGKDGIIACYDADAECEENYIESVYKAFSDSPDVDGISIKFEHPKKGSEFDERVYTAIDQYEKHLYYYIEIQKFINLPFAIHTVGSSMAVRATSYAKFGGMNKRKAGEDFYFLQKFVENGKVIECNTTKVIPSPRISERVPFGTGKAVGDITHTEDLIYHTYDPRSFIELHKMTQMVDQIYLSQNSIYEYDFHPGLIHFLKNLNMQERVIEAKSNTTDLTHFKRRFYKHFNAFQLMKYLHYMRDHYFPNIPVDTAIRQFESIKS